MGVASMTDTAGAPGGLGGGMLGGSLGGLREGIKDALMARSLDSDSFLAASATRSSSSWSKRSRACSDAFGMACEGSKSSPTAEDVWTILSAGGVIGYGASDTSMGECPELSASAFDGDGGPFGGCPLATSIPMRGMTAFVGWPDSTLACES